jgi:sulfopropanediol 3-dehydrogenase
VRKFAEAQKKTVADIEVEIVPGLIAGQKTIPIEAAGCYVPGGRYSHVASAIMTVTTAKVAGCRHITVCSPPRPDVGVIPPSSTPPTSAVPTRSSPWAACRVSPDGLRPVWSAPAGILVGPGNQFVAEAKRILFGRVGIDMFAGPTDSLILADKDTRIRKSSPPTSSARPNMATTRRSGWSPTTGRWPRR